MKRKTRVTPLAARGEPFVWLSGSGLALALVMVVALLGLVAYNGVSTFWPKRLIALELTDGSRIAGEVTREETYRVGDSERGRMTPAALADLDLSQGLGRRRLLRIGNYDLYGDDFRWVSDHDVVRESWPADLWWIERMEWGPAVGYASSLRHGEREVDGTELTHRFAELHELAVANRKQVWRLEREVVGELNRNLEQQRLEVKRAELRHGEGSASYRAATQSFTEMEQQVGVAFAQVKAEIDAIQASDSELRFALRESGGKLIAERPSLPDSAMLLSQVVRAYPANRQGTVDRVGVYLSRWWEFLSAQPREANTEGGVFPAIFGTFLMTVIMSLVVAPFGVITALYLREYARQGMLVSIVRIAVNNLAGVPSIVYGVFGLGFFCYALGGSIDSLFFPENLPSPTFGTGGILWASLTLALLTVPVVIVSTEEALAAVPRSVREGSLACGASKWQTIQRIVLPAATPGIMTGLILAMARGAGEVAPLMITGVVKLAPELPFDTQFPYFHVERSFMHLGFHIYDVGFQSRNSEAGKPMVFTTTMLLIALIAALNLGAIWLRARLKRRYASGQF